MAMGRPKASLHLAPEQKEQLEGIVRSRTLPAGLVKRARVVLLSAAGKTTKRLRSKWDGATRPSASGADDSWSRM